MSAFHCVVVWERFDESNSNWLPYGPAVARHLERAHGKQLTRVLLSDADPSLSGCYVNLRTLTQCIDRHEGTSVECGVRRACYPVSSPAGRGARWEWARGGMSPPRWEPLTMDWQMRMEEAWGAGETLILMDCSNWRVDLQAMLAAGPGGARRSIRRVQQPPYPLTRAPPDLQVPPQARRTMTIPQQHTGSSTKSTKSIISSSSGKSGHSQNNNTVNCNTNINSIANRAPAKLPAKEPKSQSVIPPQREKSKPNLARQILHNLNIFSNKSTVVQTPLSPGSGIQNGLIPISGTSKESVLDVDSSSTRSGRRHSVDTISTYLSHESKDSFNQQSVSDLLDCSMGSDDVFDNDPLPGQISRPKTPSSNGSIVGVDAASSVISGFVRVVESVQWGAVCPPCLAPLSPLSPIPPIPNMPPSLPLPPLPPPRVVVALSLCSHMMHLACLNKMLTKQQRTNKGALYIQCPVCSKVYGEMRGNQPPGTMAWCLQTHPLPGQTTATHTIQITYNVVSGIQGPEHPSPGRPYYAVGFPRQCYLPDNQQGRRVLNLLSIAWERRLVFTIGRSVTTGREHVVAWGGIEHRTERAQFISNQETAHFLERVVRQLGMRGVSDGQDEQGLYQELS